MSSQRFKAPSYLPHKAQNKGRSRVGGRDIYFPGDYDSKESRDAYRELVARLAKEHRDNLARAVGFRPLISLATGVRRFCEWYCQKY